MYQFVETDWKNRIENTCDVSDVAGNAHHHIIVNTSRIHASILRLEPARAEERDVSQQKASLHRCQRLNETMI